MFYDIDTDDDDHRRVVLTRGQAQILANVVAPFSLVLAALIRVEAEEAIGTNLSSRGDEENDEA